MNKTNKSIPMRGLIFALSPGMGLRYEDNAFDEDARVLLEKLRTMYGIGFRRFAVFFDDIEAADGGRQAELLNVVNREFIHRHADVGPLITVPTEYFTENIFRGGALRNPRKPADDRRNLREQDFVPDLMEEYML